VSALGVATLVIAIYAALVSTASAVVAYLAYANGSAKIEVRTGLIAGTSSTPAKLTVAAINHRRGAATISHIYLWGPGPVEIPLYDLTLTGPAFPATLTGESRLVWSLSVPELLDYLHENNWGHMVRGVVCTATGKRIWEDIRHHTNLLSGGKGYLS
jgi:hypothetical protein